MQYNKFIISDTINYAEKRFFSDNSGHDFQHTFRVFNLATLISENENADLMTVQLAALLHDVDDYKLFGGKIGNTTNATKFLENEKIPAKTISTIRSIIRDISFKGTDTKVPKTLEGKIVQDADRLDAIGAIGIARTFAYGAIKGRKMYDFEISPKTNMTAEEYTDNQSPSLNHFYEKLLKLKSMMNTDTAKKIAEHRHKFMEKFLDEFIAECHNKL